MEISSDTIKESHSHDRQFSKPKYEVADILDRYLDKYLIHHKISTQQSNVLDDIMSCRTSRKGGHKLKCDVCDYERIEYNSCRNRHCPKCQGLKKIKWITKRLSELLPIPYYHGVFTLPHTLNDLALYNKAVIYDIFFQSSSHTLHVFAKDPKYLGAKLGFIGILHTWGQNLGYHVHIHYIITGGGMSEDGQRWISLPYHKKFLFPVKAMSCRMRKKFSELLLKAYKEGKLLFPDELSHLKDEENFKRFLNKVAWEEWINYVKKPFAGPEQVVKYVGRYTHRVAISNHRILDIDDGKVTFRYKKYKDNEVTHRIMPLESDEFIRRFLLHVLPRGFQKIRHFGILSNGIKNKYIEIVRDLLHALLEKIDHARSAFDDFMEKFMKCPVCKVGTLEVFTLMNLSPG